MSAKRDKDAEIKFLEQEKINMLNDIKCFEEDRTGMLSDIKCLIEDNRKLKAEVTILKEEREKYIDNKVRGLIKALEEVLK